MHIEKVSTRSEAAKREREIKALTRQQKQALINTVCSP
jgi:predicted GIY-YIG superfamily endonuclease